MQTLRWNKWNKRWLKARLVHLKRRIGFGFWRVVALAVHSLYRYREATHRLFSLGVLLYLVGTTIAFLILSWLSLH
jgi:hypothetical protein